MEVTTQNNGNPPEGRIPSGEVAADILESMVNDVKYRLMRHWRLVPDNQGRITEEFSQLGSPLNKAGRFFLNVYGDLELFVRGTAPR